MTSPTSSPDPQSLPRPARLRAGRAHPPPRSDRSPPCPIDHHPRDPRFRPGSGARTTDHATFSMERAFAHPPARVFGAFAEPAAKAAWFFGPEGWQSGNHTLDFRVGGREHLATVLPDGGTVTFDATYLDIVPTSGSSTPTR